MIALAGIESCKTLAEFMVNLIPGGIVFGLVEGDSFVWVKSSDSFAVDFFKVGNKLNDDTTTMQAIHEKKVLTQNIPRTVYGKRISIVSIPVINDRDEAVGAFSIIFPKLHPIAAAFEDFAPILAEMFHEGSFLYMSDLTKIAYTQASEKFDMPLISVGDELIESNIAYQVIKSKKPMMEEIDASQYGMPLMIANFPLFDEGKEDVVATLGIVTPKNTAVTLRQMSLNLENSLTGIAAAIQQLAASASEIHSNERALNSDIKEIINISEEIHDVSTFIKEIADETKMLGLNAAIEAARAGDAGRGFGVVAEEIRKLSAQSKSTVPKIQKLTNTIKQRVDETSERSNRSLDASQGQAAATEEITASIEEITSMAEALSNISKTL